QGDETAQLLVAGAVHGPEAALAQLLERLEAREPGEQRRFAGGRRIRRRGERSADPLDLVQRIGVAARGADLRERVEELAGGGLEDLGALLELPVPVIRCHARSSSARRAASD